MGCVLNLCCKKRNNNFIKEYNIKDMKQELIPESDDNAVKISVTDSFNIEKAREVIIILLNYDSYYKELIPEVKKLNDDEFRKLFEGDSKYDYTITDKNKKEKFNNLAIKISSYKLILKEWYNKGDNYIECLKEIFREFYNFGDLSNLSRKELEKQLVDICKSQYWTIEIKDEFKDIIKHSEDMSEELKSFLEIKLVELNDALKELSKSRKIIAETETKNEGKKNIIIDSSFESLMNNILDNSIDIFLETYNSDLKDNNISNEESDKIIKLNVVERKNLIKSVIKKYTCNDFGEFNFKNGLETLKNITEKINLCKLFSSDTKDKISIAAKNKMIPHIILGISFLNLCNNIYYTYQLFADSNNKIKYFEEKLEKIKSNFIKHKKQIPLIKGDDYAKEKQMIEEIGLKIEEDKEAVEQLIDELNSSIQEQKDEKGKRIFKAVVDGIKLVATSIGGVKSEEKSKKAEFAFSSIFSGVSLISDSIDIVKLQSNINKFKGFLKEAKLLKQEINDELKKLNQKYLDLQKMQLPHTYRKYI